VFCFHEKRRFVEMRTGVRTCKTCGEVKRLSEFYRRKSAYHVWRSSCKDCESRRSTIYCKKNALKMKAKRKTKPRLLQCLFKSCSASAIKYKREFELTIEYLEQNSKLPCSYCGLYTTDALIMGVDRVDSSKGYIPSNCVPCCKKCNIMKHKWEVGDFLKHIGLIYNKHKERITNESSR
jgi:5-methylcytosine-specific restriction endonuclease McrA